MTFKAGVSGNPSGRRSLAVEVRQQMKDNADKAVERLKDILFDDAAFGREGWLPSKEQLAIAVIAMDRGYGRSENVSVTHTHSGTVGLNVKNKLKDISDKLPERVAQQRIVDAQTVEDAEVMATDGERTTTDGERTMDEG